MIYDVVLKPNPVVGFGQGKRTFKVWFGDELLLLRSTDPEFDACRALQARGLAGKLRVWRDGQSAPDMAMGIGWGAGRRTEDTGRTGPRVAKLEPYPAGLSRGGEARAREEMDA